MIHNGLFCVPCQQLLERLRAEQFTIVYLDPPWAVDESFFVSEDQPQRGAMEKYLSFMLEVLLHSHRVLAQNGSLFIHTDPQVSGYFGLMLDQIFDSPNFRSEYILPNRSAPRVHGPRIGHSSILMYSKSDDFTFSRPMRPMTGLEIEQRFPNRDQRGPYVLRSLFSKVGSSRPDFSYEWQGIRPPKGMAWTVSRDELQRLQADGRIDFRLSKRPSVKAYLMEGAEIEVGTIWDDLSRPISPKEREPFPTQQPLSLLTRIIEMSSKAGDAVLDPFCGSGTTLVAAHQADRAWLGCDSGEEAYAIAMERLQSVVQLVPGDDFEIGDHDTVRLRYPTTFTPVWQTTLGEALSLSFLEPESWKAEFQESLDAVEKGAGHRVQIYTEGKTDWKHIQAAHTRLSEAGYFQELEMEFDEPDRGSGGDAALLQDCKRMVRLRNPGTIICLFDRDNATILREVAEDDRDFKNWGNGVFSLALPVPEHRQKTPEICIEFYYQDHDLRQPDRNGRRLYVGTEFSPRTGHHRTEALSCIDNRCGRFTIIDDRVYAFGDENETNVALSKDDFAENILNRVEGFDAFDISAFEGLFRVIEEIVEHNQTTRR
jgi:DNA modification methylase